MTKDNDTEEVPKTVSHTANQQRGSTSSNITDLAAPNNDPELVRSHFIGTLALCSSVFAMMFLLVSAFPYSGFMAMQLVPGLTHESAGTYGGFLSGSFMLGRLFASYPFGKLADTYGRKFVIVFSNAASAVFSLSFGLSSSFAWAICSRFLAGLTNGTMIATRVSATELAKGNHELEVKGMGLVMSMIGYGMLVGPAIGGVLSEPIQQYPNFDFPFKGLLEKFPFMLPNIVVALVCLLSMLLTMVAVEETLPAEKLRSTKYIIPDFLAWLLSIPVSLWGYMKSVCSRNRRDGYEEVGSAHFSAETGPEDLDTDSTDEDTKILETKDLLEASAVATGRNSRASFSAALHRPSKVKRESLLIENNTSEVASRRSSITATMGTLMGQKQVRDCLSTYWVSAFASTTSTECFPLFAMAKNGGLGLEERLIGMIAAGSGLLFCLFQYFIFAVSMKKLGLHKTMTFSAFLSVIPAILIPASLLIGVQGLRLAFLICVNAVQSIFFSNFNGAITIVQNRLVHPSDRAKLNGLAAIGASLGRGFGPLFAGCLVSFSFTSGIVPTQFGSVIIYVVVAAVGFLGFFESLKLQDEDKADKAEQDQQSENANT